MLDAIGLQMGHCPRPVLLLVAVTLSVAGLLLGPVIASRAQGRPTLLAALDGATLALVPGFVLVRVLPHLVEESGPWVIAALAAGFGLLVLLEGGHRDRPSPAARVDRPAPVDRPFGGAAARGHAASLALVIVPLAVHSFFDGAGTALAFWSGESAPAIVLALVMHRVPEGLFVAALPTTSRTLRLLVSLLAAATIAGALTGQLVAVNLHGHALHAAIAVGTGGMLRLVTHRHDIAPPTPPARRALLLAAAAGTILVVALPAPLEVADPVILGALAAFALVVGASLWLRTRARH